MFMEYSWRIAPTRRIQRKRNGILHQSRLKGIGDIRIERSFVGFGMVWKNGWNLEASLDDSSGVTPRLRYLVAPYYLVTSHLLYFHLIPLEDPPSSLLSTSTLGLWSSAPSPFNSPYSKLRHPHRGNKTLKQMLQNEEMPSQQQQTIPVKLSV